MPSERPRAESEGPIFDAPFDAEVAVIGVGSTGSMALWQLAKRGVSVLGFEQFTPGHDRAATGGESRVFRIAYHEGTHYVPLLLAARETWGQLEESASAELFDRCGYLEIAKSDDEGFANSVAALAEHGLPHEVLAAESARDRFPQHWFRDDDVALLDPLGGVLRPEYAVVRATRLAESLGARVLRHTPVERIDPDPNGVTVRTVSRHWRFRRAVVTVGSWTSRLLPELDGIVQPRRLSPDLVPGTRPGQLFVEGLPGVRPHGRRPLHLRSAGHRRPFGEGFLRAVRTAEHRRPRSPGSGRASRCPQEAEGDRA